MPTIGQSKA